MKIKNNKVQSLIKRNFTVSFDKIYLKKKVEIISEIKKKIIKLVK